MNLLENLNKSKNNRTVAAIVLAEMGCEKPSIKLLSETSMLIEAARDLQKSGNNNAIKIIQDSITAKYEATDLSSKYTIPEPYVGNEKNVLVLPDTHAPYCHVDLLFKMRELQETFDLGKVIHIGDLCFPEDAEVLTEQGFKQFNKLSNSDKVAQVLTNGTSEFVYPQRIVDKEFTGNMVIHEGTSYYSETTEDHNLVYYSYNKSNEPKKIKTQKLPKGTQHRIPRTTHLSSNGVDFTDNEIRLQVALRADGSYIQNIKQGFRISFKKKRKIERFRWLLESLKIKYSEKIQPCKKDYIHFRITKGSEKFTKELREDWLTQMNAHQREVYLTELEHWDGHDDPTRDRCVFSTKHDNEAKFVQALAHISGYAASISVNETGQKRVNILWSKKDTRTVHIKTHKKYVENKRVMCVTVPSGMIMVKQNNHISVTGNCDQYSWSQYDKDPEAESASFEYAKTKEVLHLIYKLFPNVDLVTGNHDSRLNKKFRTAGLLPAMVKTLEEIYEMPDGWSVHNEYVYNDVLYLHGGVGDAYKYALNRGMNVVAGHVHTKAGVMYHATNHQTIWGMQVGTIIDDSKYVFDYSRLNSKRSILSCGIVIDGQPLVYNFGTRNTLGN